jgi:hypothetical protein
VRAACVPLAELKNNEPGELDDEEDDDFVSTAVAVRHLLRAGIAAGHVRTRAGTASQFGGRCRLAQEPGGHAIAGADQGAACGYRKDHGRGDRGSAAGRRAGGFRACRQRSEICRGIEGKNRQDDAGGADGLRAAHVRGHQCQCVARRQGHGQRPARGAHGPRQLPRVSEPQHEHE